MIAATIGLLGATLPSPTLTLAMMTIAQMERLIKGAMVPVGKKKIVVPVALSPSVGLAKLPAKASMGLVEALMPESCPDKELPSKQLCLN